jgi:hypothetical protein
VSLTRASITCLEAPCFQGDITLGARYARVVHRRVAALSFAALSLAAASAAATQKPVLRAAELYPLTVQGSGFGAYEHVRVTVSAPFAARKVRADRGGRFRTGFAIRLSRCGTVLIRAVGGQGSRAQLEIPRAHCVDP